MNESNEAGSGNHGKPNLVRNRLIKSPLIPLFQRAEKFRLTESPLIKEDRWGFYDGKAFQCCKNLDDRTSELTQLVFVAPLWTGNFRCTQPLIPSGMIAILR
jgi:hypothetical protein